MHPLPPAFDPDSEGGITVRSGCRMDIGINQLIQQCVDELLQVFDLMFQCRQTVFQLGHLV